MASTSLNLAVASGSPFAAATVRWAMPDGRCGETIVLKATFRLEHGQASAAECQEPIAATDCFYGDVPGSPLRTPSDLAPFKRHPEVTLVGRAFAANGRRERCVLARLRVGNVDKTVEVRPARYLLSDGSVVEDPPWQDAPLGYEMASGGPGTWNPSGMTGFVGTFGGPGAHGNATLGQSLPRLSHPGASWHPTAVLEPVSFGPLSPAWPSRAERLSGNGSWVEGMTRSAFPTNLDPLFFQAAPVDQLLEVLRPDELIVLEHLSPEHAELTMRLPGIEPRVRVERNVHGSGAIHVTADSLWIDTERRLCTVTWRGLVALTDLDERVFLHVDKAPTWVKKASTERGNHRTLVDLALLDAREDTFTGVVSLPGFQDSRSALPFRPADAPRDDFEARAGRAQWISEPPAAIPPPPTAIPLAPAMPSGLRAVEPRRPSPLPPEPCTVPSAEAVFHLSNAAVATASERPDRGSDRPPRVSATTQGQLAEVIDLIWFDPKAVPRIRKPPEWRAIVEGLEDRPPDSELDDKTLGDSTARVEDRRDVFEVVVQGAAADGAGIEARLNQAIREDGKVIPPLLLAAGDLSFPFDEVEELKAHLNVVSPLATGDDKLQAEIDLVRSFVSSAELGFSPSMLDALSNRLWVTFARVKRAVPAETLQAHADAVLLKKRKFQHREVFGGDHLRAVLHAGGAAVPFPTYLPATLASSLPLYQRVRVRVIAEVHPSVDQHESCSIALRVVAFARIVQRPASQAPAADRSLRGRS